MLDKVRLPESSTLTQGEIEDYLLRLAESYDASRILDITAHHSSTGHNSVAARPNHEACKRAKSSDMSSLAAFDCIQALNQASLIDDDLIDGRPSHRENPAIWAEYGHAPAIAAGDLLISVAYASRFEAQDLEPGQCVDAATRAVSAKVRGKCTDLPVDFRRPAHEHGAASVLITHPDEPPADIADVFAAYCWNASLKPGPLLSIETGLAMTGRGLAKATNRTGLASSNLAIVRQALDDCADLSADRPSGRPTGNLCLLLKEIGDLTPFEAVETARMHAGHALGRAANEAAGIPDGIGIPTARLCLWKPREMKGLLDAV